ncbi:MAG TPA: hypothetical protein VLW52_04545 [Opitutaceae bacterium]|nr:hypothetical protein [Opitutaceae bacterium]
MLSLLQKGDQSQMPAMPAWHPNFRNLERLPDTKVVRTQFFVNFAAIAVAAFFLLYFAIQEYRIKALSRQVADWQAQIDTNKKSSDQTLVLAKRFADEERKIGELNDFLKCRLVLTQFLLQIGNTLPPELAIDAVDVRAKAVDPRDMGVSLHGTVAGAREEAAGRANSYVDQLKQDRYFAEVFDDVSQKRLEPDQTSGRLNFELFLRFKGAVTKK